MFIQTEDTPNPATMKFLPSRLIVERSREISNVSQAAVSPLAEALFAIKGVQSVFLGRDFVSVTKGPEAEWTDLRTEILAALTDHLTQGRPVLAVPEDESMETCACGGGCSCGCADEGVRDVVARIRDLLDNRIRPAVAQDGGDVAFEGYEDGVVFLRLKGACAGCPSATATLKYGIEQMLKHFIPDVKEVRRVE